MKALFLACLVLLSSPLFSAEIVSDMKHALCEEFQLNRELRIYKDPSLFLPALTLLYSDPRRGWEHILSESPLLTTIKGSVHMMRLGEPQEFKGFGAVSKAYELVDKQFIPKVTPSDSARTARKQEVHTQGPQIISVKICNDAYSDALGFVLESDLKTAQAEIREDGLLPPSTRANPIPSPKKIPVN